MADIPVLERFFRSVGNVDIDKADVDRYREFVDDRVEAIAIAGRDSASWNDRDVVWPQDLPITAGLQERMREFGHLDEADEMRNLLRGSLRHPPEVAYDEETENMLVDVFGGLSVVLARSFRIIDPELKNPQTPHWDRAFQLLRMLL